MHDYLARARTLELALSHTKARGYGSVFEMGRSWPAVWDDVLGALATQRGAEFAMVERLAAQLDEDALVRLADRLHAAELTAPTRPHPWLPHTGVAGRAARRVEHAVDSFWDTVEGRMVPAPVRPPPQDPGRFKQYLLADPRFSE